LPTFAWLARFGTDFDALSPRQQAAFLAAVAHFVEDLRAGQGFRPGLRVKGVRGAMGIFEMTWADDGRATFEYGDSVIANEPHIVWRRIATHAILHRP
jgi:hypothetical protein